LAESSYGKKVVDELSLAVVGIDYANADGSSRRFELLLCKPGDPIELRPEPKNEHDERAVAVFRAGGGQLGYLTAERCGWIGGRMAAEGAVAVFQRMTGTAAIIRVRFGGGAPTLPPEPIEGGDSEPDFYPDPEGPDWGA
jgi:hypothetical protein